MFVFYKFINYKFRIWSFFSICFRNLGLGIYGNNSRICLYIYILNRKVIKYFVGCIFKFRMNILLLVFRN